MGPKGQVVISKEIRDQLGVKPGWLAIETAMADHVEIRFLPPPHNRSLRGILANETNATIGPCEEWNRARELAWAEAARHKMSDEDLV